MTRAQEWASWWEVSTVILSGWGWAVGRGCLAGAETVEETAADCRSTEEETPDFSPSDILPVPWTKPVRSLSLSLGNAVSRGQTWDGSGDTQANDSRTSIN